MTSKAFTNVVKLSSIYACGRQAVAAMEDNFAFNYKVRAEDVKAATAVVNYSMFAFEQFKVI